MLATTALGTGSTLHTRVHATPHTLNPAPPRSGLRLRGDARAVALTLFSILTDP